MMCLCVLLFVVDISQMTLDHPAMASFDEFHIPDTLFYHSSDLDSPSLEAKNNPWMLRLSNKVSHQCF